MSYEVQKMGKIYYRNATVTETPWTRPNLTGYGTLGGDSFACAVSSTYSTAYGWKAFNGDSFVASGWYASGSSNQWITFYNPVPIRVISLVIYSGTYIPHIQRFLWSDDGTTWSEWAYYQGSVKTFTWDLNCNSAHKYHRIISSTKGSRIMTNEITINAVTQSAGGAPLYPIYTPDYDSSVDIAKGYEIISSSGKVYDIEKGV